MALTADHDEQQTLFDTAAVPMGETTALDQFLKENTDTGLSYGPYQSDLARPLTPPETVPATEEAEATEKSSRMRKIAFRAGAVAAAAVVAVGLGMLLTPSSEEPTPRASTTLVEGDINTETTLSIDSTPEATVATQTPDTTGEFGPTNVEVDKTTGRIHTARFIPGEAFNQAQRPNGDLINVPKVRVGTLDDYALFESSNANLAAWITTGNQVFMQQLTTEGKGSEARITSMLDSDINKKKVEINNPAFQASIYDDPEDPVVLERKVATDGSTEVSLKDGTLYLVVTTDQGNRNNWQAPSTHVDPEIVSAGAVTDVWKITNYQIYFGPNGVNDTYIDYELVTK